MNGRRKKLLWLLLALAALTLLRETGQVRLQWYRAHYEGVHEAHKQLAYSRATGGGTQVMNKTATANNDTKDDEWGRGFGFSLGSPVAAAEQLPAVTLAVGKEESYLTRVLRDELSRAFRDRPAVQILISRAELSGAYWVPFFKRGTCSYSLALKEEGPSFVKTRTLAGDIEFNVGGFCSVRELKAELAQKIARQAASPSSDINE